MNPFWRWLITGIYLISLPFMRRVWELLRAQSVMLARVTPLAVGVALILALLIYLVRIKREKRPGIYLSLLVICALYACVLLSLQRPIERVHLAQYGLLSILVFWSMAGGDERMTLCLWAAVVTVEMGILDEFIQGLLPGRIYDFNDLLLNGKSALLGQAVVAFVLRPWEGRRRTMLSAEQRPGKIVRVAIAFAVVVVVFLSVVTISLVERGTPTITEDVHRGDGRLRVRDGFLHYGTGVMVGSAIAITLVVMILVFTRRAAGSGVRYARTVIICGLLPSLVLIAGKLLSLRFR